MSLYLLLLIRVLALCLWRFFHYAYGVSPMIAAVFAGTDVGLPNVRRVDAALFHAALFSRARVAKRAQTIRFEKFASESNFRMRALQSKLLPGLGE
jgi:hypothetical protein